MTGFFHIPSAFGVLEEKVIPALFKGKSAQDRIRIWVAGCASGEEAYSIAILLSEYASKLSAPPTIEIFATDNNEKSIEKARTGMYPLSIRKDMSRVCLEKYFIQDSERYAIIPEIKALVRFSSHDVLIGNPLHSFELITCRHLLADLDSKSQSEIVLFFHYALRENGYLFLGDAEFAESLPKQFLSVNREFKIYRLSEPVPDMRNPAADTPRKSERGAVEPPESQPLRGKPVVSVNEGIAKSPQKSKLETESPPHDRPLRDEAVDSIKDRRAGAPQKSMSDKVSTPSNRPFQDKLVDPIDRRAADTAEGSKPVAESQSDKRASRDESANSKEKGAKHAPLKSESDEISLSGNRPLRDNPESKRDIQGKDVRKSGKPEVKSTSAIRAKPDRASALVQKSGRDAATSSGDQPSRDDSVRSREDDGNEAVVDTGGHASKPEAVLDPNPREVVESDAAAQPETRPNEKLSERADDAVAPHTKSEDHDELVEAPDAAPEERSLSEASVAGVDAERDENSIEAVPDSEGKGASEEVAGPEVDILSGEEAIQDVSGLMVEEMYSEEAETEEAEDENEHADIPRIQLEEALQRIFHEEEAGEKLHFSLPSANGEGELHMEARYIAIPVSGDEVVHVLVNVESRSSNSDSELEKSDDLFDAASIDRQHTNGASRPALEASLIADVFLRTVRLAPFPMLVHTGDGRILAMSQPWVDMAGVPREDAQSISAWTRKANGRRFHLKNARLKEAYEKAGVVCVSIRTLSGDSKQLAFHSYVIGADDAGRDMTLTMAVDITNYQGHAGVGEMPEGADFGAAAKRAFLANMSHEIRTPLTSMIGFADYLSEKLGGQDVQFARYISESGNRLLETLNAVLRVAALDGVEPVMRPEWVDVAVEAQGVLQLYKPYADQQDISLKLVIEQPVKARLDRPAFRRVLSNLVENAIKFTPDGEVTITVNADADSVIVDVQDTGAGISDAFLPILFDRFSQEEKEQVGAHTGCGLGLFISRRLVEAMGGIILVESDPGKGSKFLVRLPKEPHVERLASETPDPESEEQSADEDRTRILIVEDNADTQELMLLFLRDKYDLAVASNPKETIQLVRQQLFDVILMDLNLGGRRTGFELLRELRIMKNYEEVPVLAVSALPIDVIRKELIREGFSGYIAKPFTRARLTDALDGVLRLNIEG